MKLGKTVLAGGTLALALAGAAAATDVCPLSIHHTVPRPENAIKGSHKIPTAAPVICIAQ